jgi:hypothetical protein
MAKIPTMKDVERYGFAAFPDDVVDALLGPLPTGMKREDTAAYHPETWPPDKPPLEYLHRALARKLIAKSKAAQRKRFKL